MGPSWTSCGAPPRGEGRHHQLSTETNANRSELSPSESNDASNRRLCADWQLQDGGLSRLRRLHRLAVLATLRFGGEARLADDLYRFAPLELPATRRIASHKICPSIRQCALSLTMKNAL